MDLIGSAHSRQAMDSEWARDTVGFKTRSIRQELWWNIEGIVHFKLFPNGCDISSEFYCQQLERVYTKLKQKSRFWSTERERWCSRIMPSHTPPGRPNTSLKSWRHWGSTTCSLQSWLCCMRLRPFKLNATFSEGTPIRLVWWSQGCVSRILDSKPAEWPDPKACRWMAENLGKMMIFILRNNFCCLYFI